MHHVIETDDYRKAIERLPTRIRALAVRQITLLSLNWRDARLHIKKLRGYDGLYSYRITRNYRAFFYFDNEGAIIVFEIDNRKDVYR